jgi:hypothetical protein
MKIVKENPSKSSQKKNFRVLVNKNRFFWKDITLLSIYREILEVQLLTRLLINISW